jgi:hypothetical protein
VSRIGPILLACVGLTIGAVAVLALREATLSTHQPIDPDSRLDVVLEVEVRGAERTQTPFEITEALLLACRLEVNVDPLGEVEHVDTDVYRTTLQPSLDETDRRQFKGCLEDWTIDHLLVDVLEMEERP